MEFDVEKWKRQALDKQGNLIYSTILSLKLPTYARIDLDKLDKILVKLGHDMTRQQIRAGAQNALERQLLDKEGYDNYFIPIPNQPRKHKVKYKKVSS